VPDGEESRLAAAFTAWWKLRVQQRVHRGTGGVIEVILVRLIMGLLGRRG
jgi:hypothetical protein